jgi:DNA-directed RNA polymerase specialized sigma24 family protein
MLLDKLIANQFKYWFPELRDYLNTFLNDFQQAEELASTAFTQTWAHRKQLSSIDEYRAYMFVVGRNAAYKLMNKSIRKRKQLREQDVFSKKYLPFI